MNILTYSVSGNKLIVEKGRKTTCVLIYTFENGKFILGKQFRIINLYLNLPIDGGVITEDYPRIIPPGSEFATHYISTGLIPNTNGTCQYMTFQSLSAKDESLTLSRVVAPRNELIQLYQTNYVYTIKYKMVNATGCLAQVEFLVPDFFQEPESGAAYATIDVTGKAVEPIFLPPGNKTGRFKINGYQRLLIVKCTNNILIELSITASNLTVYPPTRELILPIRTESGVVNVLIYRNVPENYSIIRKVANEFKGINSIVRGYHFSDPNFPCFNSTGNIIDPPPYSMSPPLLRKEFRQSTSITLKSTSIRRANYGAFTGGWYGFDLSSLDNPFGFIFLSNQQRDGQYLAANVNTTGVFNIRVDIRATMAFLDVSGLSRFRFALSMGNSVALLITQRTCECSGSCAKKVYFESEVDIPNKKVSGSGTFKFNNYDNKVFPFTYLTGGRGDDWPDFIIDGTRSSMEAVFTLLEGEPICNSNS